MRTEIRKITVNTAAQLLGKAFSALTTIIASFLIARRFGAEGLGSFFLMTGFATYFYLLTDFGLNAVTTRRLSAEPENRGQLSNFFNNLISFRLLEAGLLFLILSLIVPLVPFRLPDLQLVRWGIVIGLVTIFSQAIYNSCTVIFQTTLTYGRSVLASIIGNLFFLVLVFWFISLSGELLPLVAANTLGALLVSLVSLLLVRKAVGSIRATLNLTVIKGLLIPALPLGLGIVLTVIVAKADQFLLSILPLDPSLRMTNAWALGNYGLAYKFFENILVFPTYFVNAAYPLLVLNFVHDPEKFRKIFWGGLTFLVSFSVLIVILGWVLAPLILFFGPDFYLAPLALRILLLSLPLFFASAFLLFVMITQGQQNKVPFIYLSAAVFNIVLNLIFIPSYGFLGSAVITGLTELLILVAVTYFSLSALTRGGQNPTVAKEI